MAAPVGYSASNTGQVQSGQIELLGCTTDEPALCTVRASGQASSPAVPGTPHSIRVTLVDAAEHEATMCFASHGAANTDLGIACNGSNQLSVSVARGTCVPVRVRALTVEIAGPVSLLMFQSEVGFDVCRSAGGVASLSAE